ncbi:MAG: SH3 domain-containing protein [Tannerellaceae bacterium]
MTQEVWKERTGSIIHAIIFYCLLLVVEAGLDIYQSCQRFSDLSRANGLDDLMKVFFGSTGPEDIIVQMMLFGAYVWLISSIKSFGSVQEDLQTELSLNKVGSALWLNFAASVVGMIPLFGITVLISLILGICSYSMMVSAFRSLMYSPVFNAVARSGAGTLKSYAVWSIWGLVPIIGGFFRFIAWIQFIRGWYKMSDGSPVKVFLPQANTVVNVVYSEPQLPTDEYIDKAKAKTDEELKILLQHKGDYHPQLVKAAEKILLDRITGVAMPEVVTPINNEDRYKAYQPGAQKEEQAQSPIKIEGETKAKEVPVIISQSPQPSQSSQQVEEVLVVTPSKDNNKMLISILIGVLLIIGGVLVYFLWYVPYAKDRDAPRTYVVANSVFLRSSQLGGVEYNIVDRVSYGSEVITYGKYGEWAEVKANGQEGFISSAYLLDASDFNLLNGVWGDNDAKECIESSKCRMAILDYYKNNTLQSGTNGWQIYTRMKGQKPNTVFYPRIYDRNSKFTDFVFILKNAQEGGQRIIACYSFEDETEKPIFRFSVWGPMEGYIQNILPTRGGVNIVFDDGTQAKVEIQ